MPDPRWPRRRVQGVDTGSGAAPPTRRSPVATAPPLVFHQTLVFQARGARAITAWAERRRSFHILTEGCPDARPASRPSICATSRFAASSSVAIGTGWMLARACAPVRPLLLVMGNAMASDAGCRQSRIGIDDAASRHTTPKRTLRVPGCVQNFGHPFRLRPSRLAPKRVVRRNCGAGQSRVAPTPATSDRDLPLPCSHYAPARLQKAQIQGDAGPFPRTDVM